MNSIKTTNFYGIIIKKSAIEVRSLKTKDIDELLESTPMDENQELLSYGPSFGSEAADTFTKRLEEKGLVYIDDFFIFEGDFPEWISFRVEYVR